MRAPSKPSGQIACRRSMTDARVLLERHKPAPCLRLSRGVLRRLRGGLDGLADERAAARRRHRDRQAAEAQARLPRPARLRRRHEGAGHRRDRRDHARLRGPTPPPCTASRPTGTASTATPARDAQGRLWLQYWLFYYYNDFQLVGPLFSGGKHEGDWELVQLRLGDDEKPVAGRLLPAQDRREQGVGRRPQGAQLAATPLVYVARGSHANYFSARLALHRRVVRPGRRQRPADHRRRSRSLGDSEPAWVLGPASGATPKPTSLAAGLREPDQPRPPPALAGPLEARRRRARSRRPPPPAPPQADGAAHRRAHRRRLHGRRRRRARSSSRCARRAPTSPPSPRPSRSTARAQRRGRAARRRPRLRRLDERRRPERGGLRGRQSRRERLSEHVTRRNGDRSGSDG